jgi:hypothetical protein
VEIVLIDRSEAVFEAPDDDRSKHVVYQWLKNN